MKRLPHFSFALLVILLVQTGCSASVLQLRDQLDLHRGEFRQKLADKGVSLSILANVLDDVTNDANACIDPDKLKQIIEVARQ